MIPCLDSVAQGCKGQNLSDSDFAPGCKVAAMDPDITCASKSNDLCCREKPASAVLTPLPEEESLPWKFRCAGKFSIPGFLGDGSKEESPDLESLPISVL